MKPFVCPLCEGSGTHAQYTDDAAKCAACHGERIVWGPPAPTNRVNIRQVTIGDPPGTDLSIGGVSVANDPDLWRTHTTASPAGFVSSLDADTVSVSGKLVVDGKDVAEYVSEHIGKKMWASAL